MPRKSYLDVKLGDIVHSHGVAFVVTTAPTTYSNESVAGGQVVYFVGTYQGVQELGPGSGLYPFVRKPGDTWTFQRALPYAYLGFDTETGVHYQA